MKLSTILATSLTLLLSTPAVLSIPTVLPTPTLHLIGDSTCAGSSGVLKGWGQYLSAYFSPDKLTINNACKGGRSSRTYITEGHLAAVVDAIRPGEVVLFAFGHNDQSPLTDASRSRGVIRGFGAQFEDTINGVTHKPERVYTYGHYLTKIIAAVKSKGGIPVPMSQTLRKKFNNGKILRGDNWSSWASTVAKKQNTAYLDPRQIAADALDRMGEAKAAALYPLDSTHMGEVGAVLHAEAVVKAIKCVGLKPLVNALSVKGRAVPRAAS
ncbi:lipolytic protein G-D-S-L family [Fimicolochytrium jonesii]|uniref:lipolytic protein G-D-S-L family n=1 Tax=Fimicolochytrium jonesii TaxID=1396493 RepID=UPI0022FE1E39|nr:lipolytic protein G-D-S-L family [Fimicolochytrium jonesii]KAI8819052.1 lipolytic protein G-D-S-L family [Fimicolochytrium jonesii]